MRRFIFVAAVLVVAAPARAQTPCTKAVAACERWITFAGGPARSMVYANYALDAASRGYVLETGRVVLASDSASLRNDPEVQRAYLGT